MQIIHTDQAPTPAGAYSQAIVVGDLVYTAGMAAVDPVTRKVVGTDIGEQTRFTLGNISAALLAAGSSLGDVVKVTAHLAHLDADWADFDAAYAEVFGDHRPVRTTVGSQLGGVLVEIDVVAVLSASRR
jgi:2-iminobutanoate/2-iminopropanoate deaminase